MIASKEPRLVLELQIKSSGNEWNLRRCWQNLPRRWLQPPPLQCA